LFIVCRYSEVDVLMLFFYFQSTWNTVWRWYI